MPRVLCVQSCYIDRLYEEGQEYSNYNGPKSPYLKPLKDAKPDADEVADKGATSK